MTADWTRKPLLDPGNVLDVIDMTMRQQQKLEIDIARLEPVAGAIRRVEKNPAPRRLEQIAIGFKNSAAEALVNHRHSFYPGLGYS